MKSLIVAVFSLLILLPSLVIAEDVELEDPGILPDSPFYGFKIFVERVQLFFTFQEKARIKFQLKLAERRLSEARIMTARNKTQTVNRLMVQYQEHVEDANQINERLRLRNATTDDIDEWMNQTTSKHVRVLQRVIQNAPEQAQSGLQNALQNAEQNQIKIRERLTEKVQSEVRTRNTTTSTTTTTISTNETTTTTENRGQSNAQNQGQNNSSAL